jgi:crossover junction endodeoxyribonuclease RuvC
MNIIGIDPGWSGGIAYIGKMGVEAEAFTNMTEHDIWKTITEYCHKDVICYMEKVHSMPAQGVASSFKFGHNYGFVRACVMSTLTAIVDVSPMKWQGSLGCLTKGNKNVTKARAQQWFPKIKVTHGIADALLIAEYGRREEAQNGGMVLR